MSRTQPCALDTVLAEAIPSWQARCRAVVMELVLDIEEDCWVPLPPDGLRSLLDELIENAVRISGGDLVELSAHYEKREDGQPMVLRRVRDNGVGMDAVTWLAATGESWKLTCSAVGDPGCVAVSHRPRPPA
jgi:signal transduction histidine kinase